MTWLDIREAYLRVAGLMRRRQEERELAEEMAFHLAMKSRAYQRENGMSTSDADNKAKRDFGGPERWKEAWRDVARWRPAEELGRDLMLALRMLRKSPVFTLVAIVTLTLAIGANTAIFSLMNEVMLKDVPVPNAKRLAIIRYQPNDFGYAFSYPLYQAIKQRAYPAMTVFAYTGKTLQIGNGNGIESVSGALVSGQYFAALGMKPQMGRWIEPRDDKPGAPDGMVAVISDHFWRSALAADPQVLGRKLTVNKGVFSIVGVMPKQFRGIDKNTNTDIFVPFQLEPFIDAPFNLIATNFQNWWFEVGAYLNDGVTLERANGVMKTISRQCFDAVAPGFDFKLNGHTTKEMYLVAEPGRQGLSFLRLRFQKPLTVLMGLVGMVLLIACLNLATLLTARAASRNREIATRFALGAGRGRIIRQLLTESLLLALIGAALGLALAPVLARLLANVLGSQRDPSSEVLSVAPDFMVFGFTAAIAIIATVLTGTLPALRSTGRDVQGAIREGSAAIRADERRRWWPRLILAVEIALSLVLVTGAGLLGYSLVKLHQIPIGFEPKGLVLVQLDMQKQERTGQALLQAYRGLAEELQSIPGVTAVSTESTVPLSMNWNTSSIRVPGGPEKEAWGNTVGPDYFRAMKTPVLEGREFQWSDTRASGQKVILNQAAVKMLFPKGHALGEHVTFDEKTMVEVVGVVGDAKYTTLQDAAPPTAYSSATQDNSKTPSYTMLLRTNGSPESVVRAAIRIVRRLVPDIPAPIPFTMEETLNESLATERIMATLALFFGGLALLITGIGLYGTLAYATERRTGEIGIRLALGAKPANVISLICAENGAIAILGCVAGVAGSITASKTIASFLYGVSAQDPFVFGVATIALLGVATIASLVPAVRASKIDPIAAIRYE